MSYEITPESKLMQNEVQIEGFFIFPVDVVRQFWESLCASPLNFEGNDSIFEGSQW